MIDRGDIRQAIDRCSNIWASLPGAGYGQFEHKADSLIAKFKEAGGTVQRDWCMSRVTAIISALVICIIVCLSWAVNHYRDNAITYKASATKMPENWSWRTRQQLLTCRCVSVMLLRSMQNTQEELADGWKWCSADDVAAGRRRLHIKQSVSQCVKPPPPPAWIMQPPPTGRHRWTGLFHLERGWSLCKNNWKEPKYINEQRVGIDFSHHLMGNSYQCEQYTRFSGV